MEFKSTSQKLEIPPRASVQSKMSRFQSSISKLGSAQQMLLILIIPFKCAKPIVVTITMGK
jgi:hypothetical protein